MFRKNTHTDKYLPFESHSHKNDKKAVIKTLLDRAKTIPSTSTLQTEEIHNVLRALELNGYKTSFIKEVVNDTVKVNQKRKEDLRGSTCIPYVKGLLEKIKSILTKAGRSTSSTKTGLYFGKYIPYTKNKTIRGENQSRCIQI